MCTSSSAGQGGGSKHSTLRQLGCFKLLEQDLIPLLIQYVETAPLSNYTMLANCTAGSLCNCSPSSSFPNATQMLISACNIDVVVRYAGFPNGKDLKQDREAKHTWRMLYALLKLMCQMTMPASKTAQQPAGRGRARGYC